MSEVGHIEMRKKRIALIRKGLRKERNVYMYC